MFEWCNVYNQVISTVRATFGFTEWLNHWLSHNCEKIMTNDMNNTTIKLTSYFTSKPIAQHKPPTPWSAIVTKGARLFSHVQDFSLQGWQMGYPFQWVQKYGAVTKRSSKCIDKNACQKCFDVLSIPKIKDRIKRMDKIFYIEISTWQNPKHQKQVM